MTFDHLEDLSIKTIGHFQKDGTFYTITERAVRQIAKGYGNPFNAAEADEIIQFIATTILPRLGVPDAQPEGLSVHSLKLGPKVLVGMLVGLVNKKTKPQRMVAVCSNEELQSRQAQDGQHRHDPRLQ